MTWRICFKQENLVRHYETTLFADVVFRYRNDKLSLWLSKSLVYNWILFLNIDSHSKIDAPTFTCQNKSMNIKCHLGGCNVIDKYLCLKHIHAHLGLPQTGANSLAVKATKVARHFQSSVLFSAEISWPLYFIELQVNTNLWKNKMFFFFAW